MVDGYCRVKLHGRESLSRPVFDVGLTYCLCSFSFLLIYYQPFIHPCIRYVYVSTLLTTSVTLSHLITCTMRSTRLFPSYPSQDIPCLSLSFPYTSTTTTSSDSDSDTHMQEQRTLGHWNSRISPLRHNKSNRDRVRNQHRLCKLHRSWRRHSSQRWTILHWCSVGSILH